LVSFSKLPVGSSSVFGSSRPVGDLLIEAWYFRSLPRSVQVALTELVVFSVTVTAGAGVGKRDDEVVKVRVLLQGPIESPSGWKLATRAK
jgi:hypothetical protein